MRDHVYSQIMGIVTRIQHYPGVSGLEKAKQKIKLICLDLASPCPPSITSFLEAYTHDRHDEIDKAIHAYTACLASLTDDEILLRVYINAMLASLYIDAEQYASAYDLYKEVLENIHLLDDNIRSLVYCNISDMYLCLEQYTQAVNYAKQGISASNNANHQLNLAICLLNLGYAYGHLQHFDDAIGFIHQAKNIAKTQENKRILALSYGYLAQIMAKQKHADQDKIMTYFEQSELIYIHIHDKHNRLENNIFFAKYLESINQNEKALALCHKIQLQVNSNNNYGFYSIFTDTLEKLHQKSQQWDALIATQQQHIFAAEKALSQFKKHENNALIKNVDRIEDSQNQQVLAHMQEHMGAITEIGQYIATTTDLKGSLNNILTKINTILPTFEFGIALYDKEKDLLDYRYFVDTNKLVPQLTIDCKKYKTVGTYVIKNRTTVHLNTVTDDSLAPFVDHEQRKEKDLVKRDNSREVHSIILTPIILKDDVLGLLSVQHPSANQYHQHHRHLIEHLASFIAVSLENLKQRERLEKANETLDKLSRTDPLTGLYNRYQLDKITPSLCKTALDEQKQISVLMLDLDDYKKYNDVHGHLEGDDALRTLSHLIQHAFHHQNDYLFRYGGDEFLIICFDQSSNLIKEKIEVLRNELYAKNLSNPESRYSDRLSLSIGGINTQLQYGSELNDVNKLFQKADEQLYAVKEAGRNSYLLI